MTEYEDKKLIQRAQRGDSQAIGALYVLYYQAVYNYVIHRVSDVHSAEDISAEVFIKMVHKLPGYVDRGRPLLAWLYTIARNLVADHYRDQNKNKLVTILDEELDPTSEDPHQEVEQQQERDCFKTALKRLPESQRQLLIYRFIDGYPTQEIMTLLDKSDRAIRSLQHRALRSLQRALLEENCL